MHPEWYKNRRNQDTTPEGDTSRERETPHASIFFFRNFLKSLAAAATREEGAASPLAPPPSPALEACLSHGIFLFSRLFLSLFFLLLFFFLLAGPARAGSKN